MNIGVQKDGTSEAPQHAKANIILGKHGPDQDDCVHENDSISLTCCVFCEYSIARFHKNISLLNPDLRPRNRDVHNLYLFG